MANHLQTKKSVQVLSQMVSEQWLLIQPENEALSFCHCCFKVWGWSRKENGMLKPWTLHSSRKFYIPQDCYSHVIISTYKPSWAVFKMVNKSDRDAFANYSQSMQGRMC